MANEKSRFKNATEYDKTKAANKIPQSSRIYHEPQCRIVDNNIFYSGLNNRFVSDDSYEI